MYAVLGGVLIAVFTILGIKLGKTENNPWAYPFVLALYPFFYFGFAIYANDNSALLNELTYAAPIFIICILTALKNIKYSAFILSIGYIGHGCYDIVHHLLFINPGMPAWWPEFCGTIDIIIGFYIFVIAINLPNKSIISSKNV